MGESRRVLLIAESYPPVLNSGARLFSELAEMLIERGFDVLILTEKPTRYMAGEGAAGQSDGACGGAAPRVIRLPAFSMLKSVLVLRYFEQLIKMVMYLSFGLLYGRRRDVIVYSPPLPLALAGVMISKIHGRRCIANVQDLYPKTPISLGMMRSRLLISAALIMEKWVYRYSRAVTVHSEGNRDYVVQHGSSGDKTYVVLNWVDLVKFSPGPLVNGFRAKHGLVNRFIVSYAGVFGPAQDIEVVLKAAKAFVGEERICFVLAGGGMNEKGIKDHCAKEDLSNVLFLPHLKEDDYIGLLRSSDVCLVSLSKDLSTPAVPGKLQTIMAVGRPVVCSVPSVSGTKEIVEEAGCGIWVEPGDAGGLVRAIDTVLRDPKRDEMGERGRQYAERNFDRRVCAATYFKILSRA